MATILFDMFPASGHYSAILKMAKMLVNTGLKVIISGSAEFGERVEKQGLRYLIINPLLLIPQNVLKEMGLGRSFLESRDAYRLKRKTDWTTNYSRLKADILRINPTVVLLDEHYALKAGFYLALGIPVVFLQTMPDPCKLKGIPPFTGYFIPRFTVISNVYCRFLWLTKVFNPFCRHQFRKLGAIKTDDTAVYLDAYKETGIYLFDRIDVNRSIGIGIKGVPRIIMSPVPFDFPHNESPSVYRLGPMVDIHREGKIDQPRYHVLLKQIEKYQKGKNGRVIYASMGTITGDDKKRCSKFFMQMRKVARIDSENLYILSTGKAFDVNLLLPLPNNTMVFETVPQVDLLQKCDIMITHGGMNSITECVFCEVPILVYPLSRKWDQPGNSARVVFHQIGLRGRIERDSAKNISRKINKLIGNYQYYKDNVLKMKQKFEEKNNSTEVVTTIESLLANSMSN